jgi:uncharacterized protein (UPF0264 family)
MNGNTSAGAASEQVRVLVSVRSVAEALVAARAGVDFIDLKEPRAGALGALPVQAVREIVDMLRTSAPHIPISATVGDLELGHRSASPSAGALEQALTVARAIAACGVDLVKIGVPGGKATRDVALHWLDAMSAAIHHQTIRAPVLPVVLADAGIDTAVLQAACHGPFAGIMLDTAEKRSGSLFDCMTASDLQDFITTARRAGRMAGLAGALRMQHMGQLRTLAPDFAGFRSAVCAGDRTDELQQVLVEQVLSELRGAPQGEPLTNQTVAPLSNSSRMRETLRLSISSTG